MDTLKLNQDNGQPFLVRLTLGSSYIPPKAMPTLDAILWGATRLAYGDQAADCIPLKETDGVFHGSGMLCDPLFKIGAVQFFQSINNERNEDGLNMEWMNAALYKKTLVEISPIKAGDANRGTFSTKLDPYPLFSRGSAWNVGFYGCGDMRLVESLLHRLPGIGRKASRGYGCITCVDVEPVDQDWSLMRNGLPMRPIPVNLWQQLGGQPLPARKARAVVVDGDPDHYAVLCVAPIGGHLPW